MRLAEADIFLLAALYFSCSWAACLLFRRLLFLPPINAPLLTFETALAFGRSRVPAGANFYFIFQRLEFYSLKNRPPFSAHNKINTAADYFRRHLLKPLLFLVAVYFYFQPRPFRRQLFSANAKDAERKRIGRK